MKAAFLKYIDQQRLFNKGQKILLAVSGGKDSVVLVHLSQQCGFRFGIAHVNYGLRETADRDEAFVRTLGKELDVEVHVLKADVDGYTAEHGGSIQMAARDIRYGWMEELRQEHSYELIATAHHANDNLETILLNFSKQSGIAGLRGMLPKRGSLIRPLLRFTRSSIDAFVAAENLKWVEDESNASDKYDRNYIRHNVVPALEKINGSLVEAFAKSAEQLRDTEDIYQYGVQALLKKIVRKEGDEFYIPILALVKCPGYASLLYEFLSAYGFKSAQMEDIISSFSAESGKQFLSSSHQLIKDRKYLILAPIAKTDKTYQLIDIKQDGFILDGKSFVVSVDRLDAPLSAEAFAEVVRVEGMECVLNYNKLEFPLKIRRWKKGDYFYPLGMGRKKKKVSDFFTDLKMSLLDKEKVWILEDSKDRIVWVMGYRIDERFKLNRKSGKCWRVTVG